MNFTLKDPASYFENSNQDVTTLKREVFMSRNLTKSEVQAKNNAIIIGMFLSNKHFPVIFSIKVIFCDKKTTFHI